MKKYKSFFFNSVLFCSVFAASNCGVEPKKPIPRPAPELPPAPLPIPKPLPEPPKKEPEPEPIPVEYCAQDAAFKSNKGKFRVSTKTAGRIKITYPVGTNGCKMIPATFCNGTGGNLIMFRSHAAKLASHGFYVASYETAQSGSGVQAMQALDYAISQDDVVDYKAIIAGMSQGGQCAVSTAYKYEQKYRGYAAVNPMVPAFGMSNTKWRAELPKIKSPIFMFNGSADRTVSKSWASSGWSLVRSSPSYFYTANGAGHINSVRWSEDALLPFALYVLFERQDAKEYFEYLPNAREWSLVDKK